jgi:murein L,D-transpeptidase YafK
MIARLVRSGVLIASLAAAGCTGSALDGVSAKAEKPLPQKVLSAMKAKGMPRSSAVMARIFKEEGKLEIWKQKSNGRFDVIASYDICKWSGQLGPKFMEGDRQAPEGFYTVRPAQMNPKSSYHLAFNMGYPNAFDRAHGRGGSNLMVHGACSSSGCYSMTDAQIEEIYAFGRDAFRGGQREFQIQAFPFRMTAANMARYRNDPNYDFWKMLKEGYDHFEITRLPPKVDVCEKRYVFNRLPEGEAAFDPNGACPPSTQSGSLMTAYQTFQTKYEAAYNGAAAGSTPAPRPSINGVQEAQLVAGWSRKKARGERVPLEPPSMETDGTVAVTSRMGRVDSEAGRRQAALDAAAEEKARLAEAKEAEAAALQRQQEAAATVLPAAAPSETTEAASDAVEIRPDTAAVERQTEQGLLGSARKRLRNIFGT